MQKNKILKSPIVMPLSVYIDDNHPGLPDSDEAL